MHAIAADHLTADVLDVLVPCRRFFIKSYVTQDRQLPVVDEFVLRLLRVAGRVSTIRLSRFFGFKEAELQVVLLDLVAAGLVSIEGGDVSLTSAAHEMFRVAGDDGVPRVADIEAWEQSVWFDLVSRNMMRGTSYRPSPNLIALQEDPGARALPEVFARQAFETNFRDFAHRVMGRADAGRLAIYSVSDVLPAGFGYQPLAAEVQFTVRETVHFRLSFPSLSQEPLRFATLTSAIADQWALLQAPEPSATGIVDYERLTGDDRPRRMGEAGSPESWGALLQTSARAELRPIFGAPYLKHNSAIFCRALSDALRGRPSGQGSRELFWFRPGGNAWGRSLRLSESLAEIREVLRAAGQASVGATLIVPRATPARVRKVCRRMFDRGILAPSGQLPADLEVLLVPGVAACVVLHLPCGGSSLAVGSLVTDPDRLDRLERRIVRERHDSEALWGEAAATESAT